MLDLAPENTIALQAALQAAYGHSRGHQSQPNQLQQGAAHLEHIAEMLEVVEPDALTHHCAILGGWGE